MSSIGTGTPGAGTYHCGPIDRGGQRDRRYAGFWAFGCFKFLLLFIGGNSATVKNGRLSTTGGALAAGGRRSLIDSMRITGSLDLFGGGVVLSDSVIDGTMSIERGVIVRNNLITSGVGLLGRCELVKDRL